MQVTAIKQQVKRTSRYSVFVDNKYRFSLSEAGLISSGLSVGKDLSREELEALKETAVFDKAYGNTVALLARRQHSEWEVRDYLRRKNSPAPLTNEILNKLSVNGLVNDVKFAAMWIENRRLLRPISRRRLAYELKQKRVNEEVIQKALEEDETDDGSVLKELITKKRKQSRYQDNLKLMRYLSRQGFSYSDIKTALET